MNGVFLCEKPFYTVLMLGKSESQGVLFTKCHFARTKETNIPIYRKRWSYFCWLLDGVFTNVRMYIK